MNSNNKIYRRDRLDKRTGNTSSTSSFTFSDKTVYETLSSYGLSPRKSLVEKCPDVFMDNRHFWRGVLEGDGHISKYSNVINLAGSPELIESFYRYCRTLCGEMKGTISVNKNLHLAQICNFEHVFKILTELYRDTIYVLPRKYQVYLDRYAITKSEG